MEKKETIIHLVVPTIRKLNFLKYWKKEFLKCHLIVVEDRNTSKIQIPRSGFLSVKLYTWQDIDCEFGKNSWIFSRHNAGIRSYGFWKAYQSGADVVMTIDDDCYPTKDNFVQGHLDNLNYKYSEKWSNTYPNPKWMYTRGFPYKVRNKGKICLSHGLWSGALDLDGMVETKLQRILKEKEYPPMRQVIPFDYYYPMCSMNMAFRKEIAPLMYFPMMGETPSGGNWPYNRFDDIWAGFFSKKIMDHLGLGVINGSPFVEHRKASLPKDNHLKEAEGIKINEILWKKVDQVILTSRTPKTCYIELAKKVKFPKSEYFDKLRKAMIIWANLF